MTPVWFQTTMDCFGYKGAVATIAGVRRFQPDPSVSPPYTDDLRNAYITTFRTAATIDFGGQPAPAGLPPIDFTGATGISPNGLNFNYITEAFLQATQARFGLPNVPNLLMQNVGQYNGKADYGVFLDAFWRYWNAQPGLQPVAGNRPIFAVIDHDSAHHWSVPLSERAFSRSVVLPGPPRARILINFDQHEDLGQFNFPAVPTIQCSQWGRFAIASPARNGVGCLHNLPVIAHAYVRISPANPPANAHNAMLTDFGGTQWRCTNVPGVAMPVTVPPLPQGPGFPTVTTPPANPASTIAQQIGSVVQQLTFGGTYAAIDAYITVDRDFILQNGTPYTNTNGEHQITPARQAVQACLQALQAVQARLVGFDVCGLPAEGGMYYPFPIPAAPPLPPTVASNITNLASAIDQAAVDVQQFYQWATAYPF